MNAGVRRQIPDPDPAWTVLIIMSSMIALVLVGIIVRDWFL